MVPKFDLLIDESTNEFFYIDTKTNSEEGSAHANYNSGFAARKLLFNAGSTVNAVFF